MCRNCVCTQDLKHGNSIRYVVTKTQIKYTEEKKIRAIYSLIYTDGYMRTCIETFKKVWTIDRWKIKKKHNKVVNAVCQIKATNTTCAVCGHKITNFRYI